MDGWIQKAVISNTKSIWRQVTSSIPQGSILGPILLNIIVNDLDDETEWALNRLVDGMKLGGEANIPDGGAAIQSDLDRMQKCTDWLGRSSAEKNLWVLVDSKLTISLQGTLMVRNANSLLGLENIKLREILPMCINT
ncbi:hypothetical protein QYF61_008389 [Mycteria americana]|uniref:Reverse transcriptase domain-containing protein n=1 Tax=Mycteria americana TaxID=33587 RepID=A0AAN7NS83_MYCAM|nr:hypothetical protein QYF61_008389 [Mycteria americana]